MQLKCEVRGSGGHERSVWQQAIVHACTAHGECTCCDTSMACAVIAREDIMRDPMIVAAESTQCRGEQFSAMIVAVSDYSAVASACECTYNEALAFNDRTGLLQIPRRVIADPFICRDLCRGCLNGAGSFCRCELQCAQQRWIALDRNRRDWHQGLRSKFNSFAFRHGGSCQAAS